MKPARRMSLLALLIAASAAAAQALDAPNPSFEEGKDRPAGWTLTGGEGSWFEGGHAGRRAVSVTGSGEDDNAWVSDPVGFEPRSLYRVTFRARSLGGSGGTPVSGPVFCNRDLGDLPGEWTRFDSFFFTPSKTDGPGGRLRFGQWMVKGRVAFDDVLLAEARAIHRKSGSFVLGEGERIKGNSYAFEAPFESASRNYSRPLESYTCRFNTNRWVFGAGDEVVYRHDAGGRSLLKAEAEPSVTWHEAGELQVFASNDSKAWALLGSAGASGGGPLAVPASLLPAKTVWIRLAARPGREGGRVSLQAGSYAFRAAVDGPPVTMTGSTVLAAAIESGPGATAELEDAGEAAAGAVNHATVRIANGSNGPIEVRLRAGVECGGDETWSEPVRFRVEPGAASFRVPYRIPRSGPALLIVVIDGGAAARIEAHLAVSDLGSAGFGSVLPGSTAGVGLWWASSGWKIGMTRPMPESSSPHAIVRAARNETEAFQLVVRPAADLAGFEAGPGGPLRGPGGAEIHADNVEVLRVRFVEVHRPTDWSATAGMWPDPLPPFKGPIRVAAGTNQPLWVRVRVPKNAPAGSYEGSVSLRAEGWSASAPLRVEVFDFNLPDRMTCTTAFGFDPGNVWRYHRPAGAAQRRELLEKYWADFSNHHISPYDPAPLDPIGVEWPGVRDWHGGAIAGDRPRTGSRCMRVEDSSATTQAGVGLASAFAIPEGGLRLSLWHRADKGHRFIVTFSHCDESGSWMSGRNNDMEAEGTGEWCRFSREVKSFPAGAKSARLTLWAAMWRDDGATTGTVWFDDVSIEDAGSGAVLLAEGFEPPDAAALEPRFSWARWDEAMARAVDAHHFNSFMVRIPGMGGGTFHSRHEPSMLGHGENSPEYKAAFGNYCKALEEHLREKDWLDEAFVYWFDEPDPKDYAFVLNGFLRLKAAAPRIRRMLTEQPEAALAGGPDIWCPCTPQYDHEKAKARRNEGESFWWYVCTGPKAPYCTLFIDHPATELRVWLWQTWERRIEGILVWQTNYWTSDAAYPDSAKPQNPYEDPMGWTSGYDTPAGRKIPWGNGDGRFIYPPEAAADGNPAEAVMDGPVDSIRWEMLRDGVEDYEYLDLLKRHIIRVRMSLSNRELLRYIDLLKVPESITGSMTEFTRDPGPIEERRMQVAAAIVELSRLK